MLTGLVTEVVTSAVTTALEGGYSPGVDTIIVGDVAQFPANGGTIRLEDISSGTLVTEDINFLTAGADVQDELVLAGPLVNTYTDGSLVTLLSPDIPTTIAWVSTDNTQPPIGAVVPQELRAVHATALAEGPRDDNTGAPVQLVELAGVYRVAAVLAPPSVSGPDIVGLVPGISVPPSASDGVPPVTAPIVTGQPFGVGAVEFSWPTNTDGLDPIQYDYWVSLTPGISTAGPPDGFVVQPNVRISRVGGVQVPMDGVAQVYIVVRARDADGDGPNSTEVGVTPRKPDVDLLTAMLVAALEIEASQIHGQFISADLALLTKLQVGGFLDINGDDSTIVIYSDVLDSGGNRVELIRLDPTGSVFRGAIVADDISVLNGMILQGAFSQIANDAVVTIMNGVADPATPPSATAGWEQITALPAVPSGYLHAGTTDHPTSGYISRLLFKTSGNLGYVQVINTITGTQVSLTALGNVTGFTEDMFGGIVYHSGYYYIGVMDVNAGGTSDDEIYVAKFDATTCAYVAKLLVNWQFDLGPGVTKDESVQFIKLGVNYTDGKIYQGEFTGTGGNNFATVDIATFTQDTGPGDSTAPNKAGGGGLWDGWYSFLVGSFDYGSKTWLVVPDTGSIVAASTTNKATLDTAHARAWPSLAGGEVFWHQTDGRFYLVSARSNTATYYRFGPLSATETWWVSYQHVAGTDHTASSPQKSVVVAPRQVVSVQVGPYPSGVTGAKVYAGYGSSGPVAAGMYLRAETVTTARTALLNAGQQTSGANPVETNTFGAGGPGMLMSQAGGLVAKGDGTGTWPLRDDRVTQTLSNVTVVGEQIVAKWAVPAGYFKSVSDMAEATIVGQITGTATVQWRVRMGPLGTTADTLLKVFTATPAATANQFWTAKFQLLSVIQSSVLTVSCLGFIQSGVSSIVGPTVGTFAPAAVDTTVPNYITVTAQLSAGSQTLSPKSATLTKARG